jgi:hypothetical protein
MVLAHVITGVTALVVGLAAMSAVKAAGVVSRAGVSLFLAL